MSTHRRPAWSLLAAVLALVLVLAAPTGVAAAPADGPDCLPSGGMDLAFLTSDAVASEDPDVVLNGGGFGHGVGMSQYATQGAALLGCTHHTILATSYPGSRIGSAAMPAVIRIGLRASTDLTTVYRSTAAAAGGADVPFHLCDVDGAVCTEVVVMPAGAEWVVQTDAAAGDFVVRDSAGNLVWRGGDVVFDRLRAMHDGTVVRIVESGRRVKWGFTEFDYTTEGGGKAFVVQHITAAGDHSAMDRYLWGLAEVPSSWEPAALRAQAIAGRSYALAQVDQRRSVYDSTDRPYDVYGMPSCRCDLRPDTTDQYYAGFDKEEADAERRWGDAVDATAGQVLTFTDPETDTTTTVSAFYSSSHGGSSEDVKHVWGSSIPYLRAVDVSRWEIGADPQDPLNPYQRWSRGFSHEELAKAFGLATFTSITVEDRGPGGRPSALDGGGILVVGTDASGQRVEKRYSGERIRSVLGLRSGLIHVGEYIPDAHLVPERLAGDERVATSVALSRRGWSDAASVVVARSDNPADALAGSTLAGALDAPLLITPSDVLAAATAAEIDRLGATQVVMLGGEAALSPEVEQAIAELPDVAEVRRLDGANRFETAALIAELLPRPVEGEAGALIVRGQFPEHPTREWADALAVASLAARSGGSGAPLPVFIVTDVVPPETWAALEAWEPTSVAIVGGPATIPATVDDELAAAGYATSRLAGDDRYGTSRQVASIDASEEQVVVLATGTNYPDGLSAGPLAARVGGRLLLVPSEYDGARSPWQAGQHPDWLVQLGWEHPQLIASGGPVAIRDTVVDAVRAALVEGAAVARDAAAAEEEASPEPSPTDEGG